MLDRRVAAVLAIALAASGCVAPATAGCGPNVEYRNLDHTFRMCLPIGWTATEHVYGRELFVIAPYEGNEDVFQENLNVGRQVVAGNVTLTAYIDSTVHDLGELGNFTLVSRTPDHLAGLPAERLVYDAYLPEFHLNVTTTQLVAFRGDVAHVLTAVSQKGHEAQAQAEFEAMFASYVPRA